MENLEMNPEGMDKAVHEIPVFIKDLRDVIQLLRNGKITGAIGSLNLIEKKLLEHRKTLLTSIEDREG